MKKKSEHTVIPKMRNGLISGSMGDPGSSAHRGWVHDSEVEKGVVSAPTDDVFDLVALHVADEVPLDIRGAEWGFFQDLLQGVGWLVGPDG